MEAAKNAVHKITGRTGHRTDVDEVVSPAVTAQTVKPHRHEQTTEAVDREVHQDHYHTTVQPISHSETLPEKHTHNVAPQVQKEFKHGNHSETQRNVAAELGQFKNTSSVKETTHSAQAAPSVAGEHVHHHVHENVQPIVHKETIQPEVVHTTVPIHEVHHEKSQHHGMSALPMKTLDEFTKSGGQIKGGQTNTHEEYDGCPRPYNESLQTTIEKVLPGHHNNSTNTSTNASTRENVLPGHHQNSTNTSSREGVLPGHHQNTANTSSNPFTDNNNTTGTSSSVNQTGRSDNGNFNLGTTGGVGSNTHNKPSLKEKLDPRIDSDRDGKTGIME